MTYRIWNGTGGIAEGEAYFTKGDGHVVGRPYVRQRARRALRRYGPLTRGMVDTILARTVDDDEWLGCRNGYLVSAICRDVVNTLFRTGSRRLVEDAGGCPMIYPKIHLNGTAPLVLYGQAEQAHKALEAARKALVEMAPHGRDYPYPRDAYGRALAQYLGWLTKVESVLAEVETYHYGLAEDEAIDRARSEKLERGFADAMSGPDPEPTITPEENT